MAYRRVTVKEISRRRDHLVDPSLPAEAFVPSDHPLPVVGKGRNTLFVKGNVIGHHHHIHLWGQGAFELTQFLLILRFYDIVGIQPQAVIPVGLGKGKIPCRRKIILPGKIINLLGVSFGNLPGIVGAPRIHHYDFIHNLLDTFQTSGQYLLLVFDNHAKTDAGQRYSLPFYSFYILCGNFLFLYRSLFSLARISPSFMLEQVPFFLSFLPSYRLPCYNKAVAVIDRFS